MRSRHFITLAAAALLLFAAATPSLAQTKAGAGAAVADEAAEFYSCPMHPEVKSKKKGTCPKCKMDLRLTRVEKNPPAAETIMVSAEEAGPHDGHDGHEAHAPSKMNIPDVELLDQDGRKVRFYTDLVKGRTVAIQFIFTTCTTVCPPLGATFSRVQKELAAAAGGGDVRLISISVDPATDTPERLKAWGAKFKAADGWTLVTGPKPMVDELLRALGAAVSSPADHSPTVLVGNDAKGQWTRTYGLARPSLLVKLIGDAVEGRLDSADAKEQRK